MLVAGQFNVEFLSPIVLDALQWVPLHLSSGATFEGAGPGPGGGFANRSKTATGVKTNRVAVVHGVVVT